MAIGDTWRGADKTRLVHAGLQKTLILPWWPSDISRDLPVRTWSELERPDRRPLTIPGGLTNPTHSLGFTLRQPRNPGEERGQEQNRSVQSMLDDLAEMAKNTGPVTLYLAGDNRGEWHIESCNVTEIEWTDAGLPSIADVSLSLRRATDVSIKVGVLKRQRHKKPDKKAAKDTSGNRPTINKKTPGQAKKWAKWFIADKFGWGDAEFEALDKLWMGESGWDYKAKNPSSGAYGIPQALPGSKMAHTASDWQTNPETQIRWGCWYIKSVYKTPSAAYRQWLARNPH